MQLSLANDNGFGAQELQNARMIPRSIVVFILCVQAAHASLGGDPTSAAHLVIPMRGYDISTFTDEGGMRISEYTDRNGRVFAVSWTGPLMPDMQGLLGPSYAKYATALAKMPQRPLHRALRLVTPELVLENSGHMRAFSGRAYIPVLVPAALAISDVR